MLERVAQPGGAGAKDLLDDLPIDSHAGVASLANGGVDVIDLQHQTDR